MAQKICQQKMPHTIGENSIMPCVIEIVRKMQVDEKARALTKIPISNDTETSHLVSV